MGKHNFENILILTFRYYKRNIITKVKSIEGSMGLK